MRDMTTTPPSALNQSHIAQGLISTPTAHLIENVLQIGITPLLMLCGVTMNVINMAVFLRQGLLDRINLCLFSLAISDCGYILFFAFTRLHSLIGLWNYTISMYWKIRSMRLIGIYVGFLNVSNCLTTIISMERCVCVLWPLKAKTAISTRHMAILIISIFLVILPCCGIYSSKYGMATFTDPVSNGTMYRVQLSSFYLNNVDLVEASAKVFSTVLPTMTVIVVMTSTIVIAVRMRAVKEWRQQSSHTSATSASGDQRGEATVTRMLIVICIMYTVCTIPYVIRLWATLFVRELNLGDVYNNISYITALFGHIVASFNSSVNFIIYFTMSTRFRKTLAQMLGRKRDGAQKSAVSAYTASETLN